MRKLLITVFFCTATTLAFSQGGFGDPAVDPGVLVNPGLHFSLTDPDPLAPSIPSVLSPTTTPVTTAQWHFAGSNNELYSEDWIYSLIATKNKETIACGYEGRTAEHPAVTHRPTIFKLDHNGKLVWSKDITSSTIVDFSGDYSFVGTTTGARELWYVNKADDGYVAVGRGTYGLLVVEFDEDGNFKNGTPIDVIPARVPTTGTSLTAGYVTFGDGFSVAINPNTPSIVATSHDIIVGGRIYNGALPNDHSINDLAGLLNLHYSIATHSWTNPYCYYSGEGGSSINIRS